MTLYPMLAGGGYGRKLEMDAIEQAAIIAVRLRRPVQLTWPRIQEIENDRCRPAAAARMTAWVAQGRLQGWQRADRRARDQRRSGGAAGRERLAGPPRRRRGRRARCRLMRIANVAIDHVATDIGVETGYWRGAAHSYTGFFTESFIDELARTLGMEPLVVPDRPARRQSAPRPRAHHRDLDRRLGRRPAAAAAWASPATAPSARTSPPWSRSR